MYHMSVYDVAYKKLGHTHPVISNATKMGEHSPHKKEVELERDYSLILSIINPERSLETHKIFHPEK